MTEMTEADWAKVDYRKRLFRAAQDPLRCFFNDEKDAQIERLSQQRQDALDELDEANDKLEVKRLENQALHRTCLDFETEAHVAWTQYQDAINELWAKNQELKELARAYDHVRDYAKILESNFTALTSHDRYRYQRRCFPRWTKFKIGGQSSLDGIDYFSCDSDEDDELSDTDDETIVEEESVYGSPVSSPGSPDLLEQ